MYKLLFIFSLVASTLLNAQKIPLVDKTNFTEQALQESVVSLSSSSLTIQDVLQKHNGKIKVIDIYASWCGDCIKGLPKLKELQKNNPDVVFIYLSMDKSEQSWKDGIKKYNLSGENYYMGNNWKNNFSSSIDLNWIPRYLVVDQLGNIAKYYAVTADDPDVQVVIDRLRGH